MQPGLESTAYHEAGHAVVMLGLGVAIDVVSIIPHEGTLGRVDAVPRSMTGEWDPTGIYGTSPSFEVLIALGAQGRVLILEAGGAAQRIAGFAPSGCRDDETNTQDAAWDAAPLLGGYTSFWLLRARRDVESYLRQRWPAVERIAAALMRDRELTGERVRELAGPLPLPDMSALKHMLQFARSRPERRGKEGAMGNLEKFVVVSGFCAPVNGQAATGRDVYPGDIVELSPEYAAHALSLGRVRPVSDAEAAALSTQN